MWTPSSLPVISQISGKGVRPRQVAVPRAVADRNRPINRTAAGFGLRGPNVQDLSFTPNGTHGGFTYSTPFIQYGCVGKLSLSKIDNRRHQRDPYLGAARISWEDERGLIRYAEAKCLDVSQEGLCILVAEAIPVRSILSLRVEGITVAGSATVRYIAWRGCKCFLGLNLSQTLAKNSLNLAPHSSLDGA
jgi:hypothetical protein